MGEWERKAKAKKHQQLTERGQAAGGGGRAASTDEVYVQCQKIDSGTQIPYGIALRLVDRQQSLVSVYMGVAHVGEVLAEGTRLLREQVGIASRSGRSVEARNVTATEGTEFTARVYL